MRNRYLVAYDVSDDKRLRRIYRCLHGYGDPVQYSVFRCDLSPQERILMLEAIREVIHQREDQVLIIDLGPVEGRGDSCIEVLGRGLEAAASRGIVI